MRTVREFVDLCIAQRGDPYVWGAKGPGVFDCSGLVSWSCGELHVSPAMPGGSWNQLSHCLAHGLGVSIDKGVATFGALLFMGAGGSEHVAVSLGNGMTIEARGRAYGVNEFGTQGRPWSAAALIPGLDYTNGTAPKEDDMAEPGPAVDAVMFDDGTGYVLDRWGGISSVGPVPSAQGGPYWKGKDVARRLIITDRAKPAGYVLDLKGALHPFGGAAAVQQPAPFWP
jgi:cell wall-associated NlpC family hydrolase